MPQYLRGSRMYLFSDFAVYSMKNQQRRKILHSSHVNKQKIERIAELVSPHETMAIHEV
jgi:hypothetical protein